MGSNMRPEQGDKEKCVHCGNCMDRGVLQAHILRKHGSSKVSPESSKVKNAKRRELPTVVANFKKASYELWKNDVRSMMLDYQNRITSLLTTFNKPFGDSLKANMLIACQFQKVMIQL